MKWLPITEDLRHYLISCLHPGNVYDTLEANIMWAPDIGKQGTQDIKDKDFDWLFQRNQHFFLVGDFKETRWRRGHTHIGLLEYFMLFQKAIDLCKLKLVGSFIKLSIFTSYSRNFPIKSYWRHLRTKVLKSRRKVLRCRGRSWPTIFRNRLFSQFCFSFKIIVACI